jgi:hypothetical protein
MVLSYTPCFPFIRDLSAQRTRDHGCAGLSQYWPLWELHRKSLPRTGNLFAIVPWALFSWWVLLADPAMSARHMDGFATERWLSKQTADSRTAIKLTLDRTRVLYRLFEESARGVPNHRGNCCSSLQVQYRYLLVAARRFSAPHPRREDREL